ncbi:MULTISPECIES: chromosome segregation protein [unclassified Bacillus (in: firmicutes)]|uniref:chromosome segregation protein n=1 Tax=unclassified Bacillus (in: firmicutes) TaxID=185979 RepID=UPI0008DF3CD7|nr:MULTISPECIES: chromosome segregation protein [unclassified Bacillus (in: firmicutes)]SFI00295.1 chromosome-anchoring protein RacA [Bacillus sp. 71mf]SFS92897.1 chromosome-anchoring protein RacA [Bacillus sp. 103mf]
MEYKTPMIAKTLGISPKAVIRLAQQIGLELKKNKFGHYVFYEKDLQQMLEFQRSTSSHEHKLPSNPAAEAAPSNEMQQFIKELKHISLRLDRLEEKLQEKADDVVSYQLLQHRNEIEEMHAKIEQLEAALKRKEPIYITPEVAASKQEEKPKRRKMILNIFGF